jgi:hypothetical protein
MTQAAAQTIVNAMALIPNITPDIINAGIKAIITSRIILEVSTLSNMCGEEETTRFP